MKRVVILGPGGAGKSTLAARLSEITGLPVIELDKHFWQPGLVALSRPRWAAVQGELASGESWIMDGDLGPYDVLDTRLRAADTVVFLDFSPARGPAVHRAARRPPAGPALTTLACATDGAAAGGAAGAAAGRIVGDHRNEAGCQAT